MTGFINEVWPDNLWPISRIERISPSRKRDGKKIDERTVALGNGDTIIISESQHWELMRRPQQLIPAEAGIRVIRCGTDNGEDWISREPVIAWALCLDGEIRAVTPDGVANDDERGVYVEYPNTTQIFGVGEYTDPVWFDSIEVMQEHFQPKPDTSPETAGE